MLARGVGTVKVADALNIAKSFAVVQLNADIESIRFIGAKLVGKDWEIDVFFKEKNLKIAYVNTICISDTSGEVTNFSTRTAQALR